MSVVHVAVLGGVLMIGFLWGSHTVATSKLCSPDPVEQVSYRNLVYGKDKVYEY